MITSKDNEKLKLIRKLAERKHREREGLFVTEGEDLLEAGLASGAEPAFVLAAEGSGIEGEQVEASLLAAASQLASGTRVIAAWPCKRPTLAPIGDNEGRLSPCVYLHGISDPANVGAIVRTADALAGGSVVLGPDTADPYSPKAVRASMGSIFSMTVVRGEIADTPSPRLALVAHGGAAEPPTAPMATLCLGSERDGLPADVAAACEHSWTIPLRDGTAESLNVAAAAAIALQRIGSAGP